MTVFTLVINIILSAVSLARGFSIVGLNTFAAWVIFCGAIWLLAVQQNWDWVSSAGLLLAIFAAAFGLTINLSPGWMFAGGFFALSAWDLSDFRTRMRLIVKDDNARKTEQRHLLRITLLLLTGLGLASGAMFLVQAEFTLEWSALIILVVLLGFAQLISWFRKQPADQ